MIQIDVDQLVRSSVYGWLSDNTARKYLAVLTIVFFIISFIAMYTSSLYLRGIEDGTMTPLEMATAIGAYFVALMVIILIQTLTVITMTAFTIKLALKKEGRETINVRPVNVLALLAMSILVSFAAFFSAYKLKLLLIPISGSILLITGIILYFINIFVATVVISISAACLIGYIAIMYYNVLRLMLSDVEYVTGNSVLKSMRFSWEHTEGKILPIFASYTLITLILVAVTLALTMPSIIYTILLGAQAGLAGQSGADVTVIYDIGYWVLSIPTAIVSAWATMTSAFFITGIYTHISRSHIEQTPKKSSKPTKKAKKK